MSFNNNEGSLISKRFVSESEIAEIKKKREEEWKIAREQGRKIEYEEDAIHDGRTLYERLKEQNDKKQEEFEEQLKFKNMIYKGLDDEDAKFLSEVSEQQAEVHNRRFEDESSELMNYRAAVVKVSQEVSEKAEKSLLTNAATKSVTKSFKDSIKPKFSPNVIIRKRSGDTGIQGIKAAKSHKHDKTEDGENVSSKESEENHFPITLSKETSIAALITYSDTDSSDNDT